MADTKITDLTSAAASTGDELVVSTTAATDRKVRAESIANLANALGSVSITSGTITAASVTNSTISTAVITNATITNATVSSITASSGTISLSSGTASVTPLTFKPGTLNTTSTQGALEYDGTAFYGTVATSARGIVPTEQIICQSSAYTGTTAGTAQKMFDASTGLNGAVNVGPSVSYMFETAFTITGRSTLTHVISYGFGGTAAIDRQTWTCLANTGAASSVPGVPTMVRCTVNNSPINLTNTSSTMVVFAQGRLTIGTSGTIIPQITRSASVVNLVIAPDSYFRIWPLGTTSFTRVGHWS
jgi:hypothetical protein